MIGLIGKKLGMTRTFQEDGRSIPVTVIQAGPCVITQVKDEANEGYSSVQMGFGAKKPKNTPMPMQGHFRKAGTDPLRSVAEFRVDEGHEYKLGDTVNVSLLAEITMVDVTGTTKGRGFSGSIKRHGQHRGPDGHGSKNVRASGSIGMHTFPGRVLPGKAMPGQYGNKQETKRNLTVVAVDQEKNLILVKGSVPGHRNGIVYIRPSR
ncbi:MAG: 50S ribosomal protein L3 [Candidatus Krumholzibacteria bacterium]|nr:50S ribosomal protein L3 [Candidatus Krumholzibacteria bacterium]